MTPVNAKHYLHDDIIRKLTELKLAELSDYVDELCASRVRKSRFYRQI